jgi:hypothetical protein
MSRYDVPDDAARVLVAVINRPRDLALARDAGWYRVPLAHLPQRFAAEYLAFYQTAAFGAERWAVRYYAPVLRYRITTRVELLPAEPNHPRAAEQYYRIDIGPLGELPIPVPAARLRRVTFINTSYGQLRRAADIRELFAPIGADTDDDDLWGAGLAGRRIN